MLWPTTLMGRVPTRPVNRKRGRDAVTPQHNTTSVRKLVRLDQPMCKLGAGSTERGQQC